MMTVQLPNVGHVKLRLESTTTARDLLPHIAKKHRIRFVIIIQPSHIMVDYIRKITFLRCQLKIKRD